MPSRYEAEIHQTEDRIPILATGDDGEEENVVLGTIFGREPTPRSRARS